MWRFCFASIILWALTQPARAFDSDGCGKLFPRSGDMHPPWYAPLYAITMIPSTTSYFSSFGACSMYGGPKRVARMQFLSETYETLRTEAARGTGDHLVAFASLAGCPVNLYPEFSQLIRRQLAGEPIAGPPVFGALLDRLETAIASDSNLGSACKLN